MGRHARCGGCVFLGERSQKKKRRLSGLFWRIVRRQRSSSISLRSFFFSNSFDSLNRRFVESKPDDFFVLSKDFACDAKDEVEFFGWLKRKDGKIVCNLDDVFSGTRFAEWEKKLVSINVQFYREVLKKGMPAKVEYRFAALLVSIFIVSNFVFGFV
jgi:hypothetical protein